MPKKPLALVTALAVCDYLLWNWSSEGKSTVLALISGLALAPLLLVLIWLVALAFARVVLLRPTRGSEVPQDTPAAASEPAERTARGTLPAASQRPRTGLRPRGEASVPLDANASPTPADLRVASWQGHDRRSTASRKRASSDEIAA